MLLLVCLLGSSIVQAMDQSARALDEESYYGELPVVLSVTRLKQPAHLAPASVTTIDREMIRASGAREVADLLRMVPGFQVFSFNGHQRSVGYAGLQDAFSRRMQVLIDGRSVYSPLFGGVFWSDLPVAIEDIERIEVVRGPNAVTYGANAFLGVINIITRSAAESHGRSVKYLIGNDGIHQAQYRQGGRVGGADYRVTLQYEEDNGFENPLNDLNDDKRLSLFTLRLDQQLNLRDSVSLQAGLKHGILGDGEFSNVLLSPLDSKIDRFYASADWRRQFAPEDELALKFYYNRNHIRQYRVVDTTAIVMVPSILAVDLSQFSERIGAELTHSVRLREGLRGVWGSELRYETVFSPSLFNQTHNNHLLRLFGNLEWQASERLLVNFGAMLEENRLVSPELSPRLGLNYQLAPGHTARASASRATRTPSLFEARADYFATVTDPSGTTDLAVLQEFRVNNPVGPEEIDAFELGYLFQSADRRTSADIKIYRYFVEGLLDTVRYAFPSRPEAPLVPNLNSGGTTRTYINQAGAKIDGLEVQFDHRLDRKTRLTGFATVQNIEAQGPQVNEVREYNTSAPENSLGLLVMHSPSADIDLSLLYQTFSAFKYRGGGDQVGGQDRLDVRAAKRFSLDGIANAEVSLALRGLAGNYVAFKERNTEEPHALLALSLQFD